MLQTLQLELYNRVINPFVDTFFSNQIYKTLTHGIIALGTGLIGSACGNQYETVTKCAFAFSSTALSSAVGGILYDVTDNIKSNVESAFEYYEVEEYSDYISPVIDISSSVALRQAAGLAINTDMPDWLKFGGQKASPILPVSDCSSTKLIDTQSTQGFFSKVYNGISSVFNFGNISSNNEGNVISETLNTTAIYTMFGGLLQLSSAVYNSCTGANKINNLSVYDIRKILSVQSDDEMTKEDIKIQSSNMFNQFKACEQYYNNKPDAIREKIDLVTGIYSKSFAGQQKDLMKTAISNPELLEKSLKLIDTQTESIAISRLMTAKQQYAQLQQFSEMGLFLNDQQRGSIKHIAEAKLNSEINELKNYCDISSEQENAYKALYETSTKIGIEFEILYHNLQNDFI